MAQTKEQRAALDALAKEFMGEEGEGEQKTMKKHFKTVGLITIGIVIGYILFHSSNSNARLEYGDTGAPKKLSCCYQRKHR